MFYTNEVIPTESDVFAAGAIAKDEEISRCVKFLGYYDHPTQGRLRANSVSRLAFVFWGFVAACALITVFALQNLRMSAWQEEAARARTELASAQAALADQQACAKTIVGSR